jgi:hypothetical protein
MIRSDLQVRDAHASVDEQLAELTRRRPWLRRVHEHFSAAPGAAATTLELAGELDEIVGISVRVDLATQPMPTWSVRTPSPFEPGQMTTLGAAARFDGAADDIDALLTVLTPPAGIVAGFAYLRRELAMEQWSAYFDGSRGPCWMLVALHCNMTYVVAAQRCAGQRGGALDAETYQLYALLDRRDAENGKVTLVSDHGALGLLRIYQRLVSLLRTFVMADDPLDFDTENNDSMAYRGGLADDAVGHTNDDLAEYDDFFDGGGNDGDDLIALDEPRLEHFDFAAADTMDIDS